MKLKDKIKVLASMGIIVTSTSCVDDNNFITSPNELAESKDENLKTDFNNFTPVKGIILSTKLEKELLVLGKLASDVLDNPEAAIEFKNCPEEYFRKNGIINADFDLESVEVKVILALGDSDVRNALLNNDITKFVNILHKKKYIDYDNYKLNNSIKSYLDYKYNNNPNYEQLLKKYSNDASIEAAVAVVPVWVVAVVLEEVAVAYNVGVGVNLGAYFNIYAWTNTFSDSAFETWADTSTDSRSYIDFNVGVTARQIPKNQNEITMTSDKIIFNNPILKLWSYHNNCKDTFVMDEIIEQNVEETSKLIKDIEVFKNSPQKIDDDKLNSLLREIITKRLSESKVF